MDVFEEVQRQCARPVEQQDIFLLQVNQVGLGHTRQQGLQRGLTLRAKQPLVMECRADFRDGPLQVGAGVAEQGGKGLEHDHDRKSVGERNFLPPPNSLPPEDPVEQPLPSVKPQPDRRS